MDHQKVIAAMTREEKFKFLTGVDMNHSYAMPRHGIQEMAFHDSPFGVKKLASSASKPDAARKAFAAVPNCAGGKEVPATAFPNGCALGATWDTETLEEVGQTLGREFRAYGINAMMGPAVNIKRHPLCGRNFEYMSEDPVLAGRLGAAYTRGVQSQGVASCPKHYIANNQERGRFVTSSEMDERTMREIYLRPFETIVKEAHPWSMMCAYNRINGVHASEHKQLLQEILRQEWGFDGIIISDWGSVHNRAVSLLASVEMCMPFQQEAYDQLVQAMDSGLIDEDVVDAAIDRILTFYERTAAVQEEYEIDFEADDYVALKAARKAMTLLKNDGQLPLNREKVRRLLVIGDRAVNPFYGGDGSSKIQNPTNLTRPLEEIKKLARDMEVTFLGREDLDTYRDDIGFFEGTVVRHAAEADAVVVFLGQSYGESSETMDRNHMEIEPDDEHIVRACARCGKKPIVVLNIGAAVTTANWEKCAGAILVSWMAGQAMGRAVAETIFGLNNPAGRLAETFPMHPRDVLALQNYPGNGRVAEYSEKLMVGYRHFDTNHVQPAYEFGFGLSYSKFAYSNLKLEDKKLTFDITNESSVDGEEVAQVYISFPEESWNSHPEKELRAFRRIPIRAGQTVNVEIELTERDFQYYNPSLRRWVSETGTYTVRVGGSSRNLPLEAALFVTCEEPIYTEACVND